MNELYFDIIIHDAPYVGLILIMYVSLWYKFKFINVGDVTIIGFINSLAIERSKRLRLIG